MANSPFSFNFAEALLRVPNFGHQTSPPRVSKRYPYDLDASLRYLRPAKQFGYWPEVATYPNGDGIGMVSGICRTFDAVVWAGLIARLPWGPLINAVPPNPVQYVGEVEFPQLPQIGSTSQQATSV